MWDLFVQHREEVENVEVENVDTHHTNEGSDSITTCDELCADLKRPVPIDFVLPYCSQRR